MYTIFGDCKLLLSVNPNIPFVMTLQLYYSQCWLWDGEFHCTMRAMKNLCTQITGVWSSFIIHLNPYIRVTSQHTASRLSPSNTCLEFRNTSTRTSRSRWPTSSQTQSACLGRACSHGSLWICRGTRMAKVTMNSWRSTYRNRWPWRGTWSVHTAGCQCRLSNRNRPWDRYIHYWVRG